MREYDRVEPLFQQAQDIRKSVLGEQHPEYATSLSDLASFYSRMGDDAQAEPLWEQSRDIFKATLGPQHPSYAVLQTKLGLLYVRKGEFTRAESLLREAANIHRSVAGDEHPDYALALNYLAELYAVTGEHARAEPLYAQAVRIQRSELNENARIQSARQQSLNQRKQRFFLDTRLANAVIAASSDPAESAADLWQWKGAVTARQQAYRRISANPQLSPLFAELRGVTRQLSAASRQVPIPPVARAPDTQQAAFRRGRSAWEQRVAGLTREREELEREIAANSVEFRRISEPLTADEVRTYLPKGAALIDFLEYERPIEDPKTPGGMTRESHYLAFVIRHGRPVTLVPLGSAESIGAAITAFRRPLAAPPGSQSRTTQAGEALRTLLWLPLEKHLAEIDTVLISPDTSLGLLPFGALPGKTENSYLIEQYKFASLPLAGLLRPLFDRDGDAPQPEKGLLVLGDVNYGAPSLAANAQPVKKLSSRMDASFGSAG